MAQANNAQREPSMEEILASIRRIIEDSDSGAAETRKPAIDPIAPALDPEGEDGAHFAENLTETRPGDPQPVAAFRPEPPVLVSALRADAVSAPRVEAASALHAGAPARIEPPVFRSRVEPASRQAELMPRPAEPAPRPVEPAADIVSLATGQKVAAAFSELSEAFAAQRRRSFDELAEEMLRPMLREWLDDNLPTMVERLVREEIERIARGDRA